MAPPDATVVMRVSDVPFTANEVMLLLPALTAKRNRPSALSDTAPPEPSPAPVPLPCVANDPAGVSDPSAARLKARTALPEAALPRMKTAPTSVPPTEAEGDSEVGRVGEVASRLHAARVAARRAKRDSLSIGGISS